MRYHTNLCRVSIRKCTSIQYGTIILFRFPIFISIFRAFTLCTEVSVLRSMTHHDPLTANAHASPVVQLSPIADALSSALVVKVVRALSISLLAAPGGAKYLWFYLRSSLWKFYLLGSTIMAPKWRRMYSISLCLFSCASLFSLSSWYDILRVPINQGSRVSALFP